MPSVCHLDPATVVLVCGPGGDTSRHQTIDHSCCRTATQPDEPFIAHVQSVHVRKYIVRSKRLCIKDLWPVLNSQTATLACRSSPTTSRWLPTRGASVPQHPAQDGDGADPILVGA